MTDPLAVFIIQRRKDGSEVATFTMSEQTSAQEQTCVLTWLATVDPVLPPGKTYARYVCPTDLPA